MDFATQIDSLVPILASLDCKPNAEVAYDAMCDALVWEDEKLFKGLTVDQLGCLRAIFNYRTSLILDRPNEAFAGLWQTLLRKCPNWIGFDQTRCMPSKSLRDLYDALKSAKRQ